MDEKIEPKSRVGKPGITSKDTDEYIEKLNRRAKASQTSERKIGYGNKATRYGPNGPNGPHSR